MRGLQPHPEALPLVPWRLLLAWFLAWPLVACGAEEAAEIPVYRAEVIDSYPHDPDAFTQGLVIDDSQLFEGTGRNGESSLRLVDLETGELLRRQNLPERYFGEGITVLGDRIYQLTWRSNTGFIYDRETFETRTSFYLPGEGWGITDDGEVLIVSDGSSYLRFLDPESQEEIRRVQVTAGGSPVDRLNELEYINGEVWANIWYADYIVRIDPQSGSINSLVDLRDLYPAQQRSSEAVLNGIAWDAQEQRLFVTGKLWPRLYEIQVRE